MSLEHKSFGDVRLKSYESRVQVKSINEADYTVEVLVTQLAIDREGEVVLPSAVSKRLPIYFLNPILLWNHERKGDPEEALGVCLALNPTEDGLGWVAKFRYDVEINPKSALVWSQIVAKTIRSWSISFLPWGWVTRFSSADEINALPPTVRSWLVNGLCKVVYTDVEIIEISNVHIASCREAVLRSLKEPDMKVNPEQPGQLVKEVAKAVEPQEKGVVRKYHPKVNDVASRLRNLSYSLEGPGWDEYDSEKMPPPERVVACLDILDEIRVSMQSLLAAAPEAVPAQPVQMGASNATEKSSPEASPEPTAEAILEPSATDKDLPEDEIVVKEFDPLAAARRYLDSIFSESFPQ